MIALKAGSAGGSGGLRTNPLEVVSVGGVQNGGAVPADLIGAAVVHVGGRVQSDAGMLVFVVVPAEEPVAVHPGRLDR